MAIVAALRMVDEVFVEESLELKRDYIEQYGADVLVMGDDWAGRSTSSATSARSSTCPARRRSRPPR